MKIFLPLLLVLAVGACAPFGDAKQAHRYYVLEPALPKDFTIPARMGHATSAAFYDTEAMVYSRAPGTRGYYQQNSWTEAPARRIAEVIGQRSSGKGPLLSVHLVEMYHDASTLPGTVRVALAAELAGKGRRRFEASAPAASFDAAGAVKGCNEAVGKLLEELQSWASTDK